LISTALCIQSDIRIRVSFVASYHAIPEPSAYFYSSRELKLMLTDIPVLMFPSLYSVLSTWLHAEVKRQGAQDRDSLFIPLRPSSAPSAPNTPLILSFIDGNQDFGSETAGLDSCMAIRKCPRLGEFHPPAQFED
jgi:hypothetical protein